MARVENGVLNIEHLAFRNGNGNSLPGEIFVYQKTAGSACDLRVSIDGLFTSIFDDNLYVDDFTEQTNRIISANKGKELNEKLMNLENITTIRT